MKISELNTKNLDGTGKLKIRIMEINTDLSIINNNLVCLIAVLDDIAYSLRVMNKRNE